MVDEIDVSASESPPAGAGRRKSMIMVGVLLGVMLVEGLTVFVLVKKFGAQPETAEAGRLGGLDPTEGQVAPVEAELEVAKVRAQNEKSRVVMSYELTVYATVLQPDLPKLQSLVEQKSATIRDRFGSIVRSADPRVLNEPDLATLRQQFLQELKQIAGDEKLIHGVLIPSIVSSRVE